MKRDKFVIVMSVVLLIVMLIGTTFAYFAATVRGNNSVNVTSARASFNVGVTPLYTGKSIVPMDDDDVMTGYENECIDQYGYGACYAYTIHVENTGDKFEYVGSITFDVTDIENLKYILLDDDEEKYVDDTAIESGTPQSLGDSFMLDSGDSRDFVLVIWLTNLDDDQNDYDGGGSFNASVTYTSTYGSKITASISN